MQNPRTIRQIMHLLVQLIEQKSKGLPFFFCCLYVFVCLFRLVVLVLVLVFFVCVVFCWVFFFLLGGKGTERDVSLVSSAFRMCFDIKPYLSVPVS